MSRERFFRILFVFSAILINSAHSELQNLNDDELLNIIRTEKYVVALFTRNDCDRCVEFERELSGMREDLVDVLNSWVVKVENSQLTRLYSPAKEPVLVFFRHGVPLLYEGPLNDELIQHTFTQNKEPAVKELTDENFEHLTQAASGATTGDWLVMFVSNDCVDCQRFQARWEAVGARLKTRMNVARVNRGTTGAATARRFGVFHVPAVILFRQGKMYRYEIHKYDVDSLVAFAQDWYKNVQGERVPLPKTPFDDLTTMIADYLKENVWLRYLGFGTFLMGIVGSFFMRLFRRRGEPKPSSSKPQKDVKEKESKQSKENKQKPTKKKDK